MNSKQQRLQLEDLAERAEKLEARVAKLEDLVRALLRRADRPGVPPRQ